MPKSELSVEHSELMESLNLEKGVVPYLEDEIAHRDSLAEAKLDKKLKLLKR